MLTGQDGFSTDNDQARRSTSTPDGLPVRRLCAAASADAHCTVDPNTVPKLIDVITPDGVSQSDEVDYTLHPSVVLSGVTIP